MNILDQITQDYKKQDVPNFKVGDTVKVHIQIKEGSRERIQIFEGFVLKKQNGGISETFTVRKIASGVGVEKTFPIHSPKIDKIEVVREGDVRRAKLNYMRDRTGKSAKIKNKIYSEAEIASIEAAKKEADAAAADAERMEAEAKARAEAEAKAAEEAATEETEAVAEEPAAETTEEAKAEEPASEEEKTEEAAEEK